MIWESLGISRGIRSFSVGVRELVYDGSFFHHGFGALGDISTRPSRLYITSHSNGNLIYILTAQMFKSMNFAGIVKGGFQIFSSSTGAMKDTFLVEGYQIYRGYSAFEWQNIECSWFL